MADEQPTPKQDAQPAAQDAAPAKQKTDEKTQDEPNQQGSMMKMIMGLVMSLIGGDGIMGMIMSMFTGGGEQEQQTDKAPAAPASTPASAKAVQKESDEQKYFKQNAANTEVLSELDTEKTIGAALTSLSNTTDANNLQNKDALGFSDGKGGYGKDITGDSMKQVSITTGNETHYFQQVASENNPQTGFKATAYVETDKDGNIMRDENGKAELRLSFAGYTAKLNDGSGETKNLGEMAAGNLSGQASEAAVFTDRAINNPLVGGREKISHIAYASHSAGTVNALTSMEVAKLEGVDSRAVISIEPEAANGQKELLKGAMDGANTEVAASKLNATMQGILLDRKLATPETAAKTVAEQAGKLDQDVAEHVINSRAAFVADHKLQTSQAARLLNGKGLDAGMQDLVNGGVAKRDGFTEADNPQNKMIGTEVYQLVSNKGQEVDPAHRLANNMEASRSGAGYLGIDEEHLKQLGKILHGANTTMADNGKVENAHETKVAVVAAAAPQPDGPAGHAH